MKKILAVLMTTVMCMVAFGASTAGKTESKTSEKVQKVAMKDGKAIMHQKRDELYDSLEERVFRAPGNAAAHDAAVNDAFRAGKQRMQFLLLEEENISAIEKSLGEEDVKHDFLNPKYDDVVNQYKDAKSELDMLNIEHKKLTEYLGRLEKMKVKVQGK